MMLSLRWRFIQTKHDYGCQLKGHSNCVEALVQAYSRRGSNHQLCQRALFKSSTCP